MKANDVNSTSAHLDIESGSSSSIAISEAHSNSTQGPGSKAGPIEENNVHSTSYSSPIQMSSVNSNSTQAHESNTNQNSTPTPNLPYNNLLLDPELYNRKCLHLYKAALKGDWGAAKSILGNSPQLMLREAITGGYQTVLHVATGAKRTKFVKQMFVGLTEPDNLLKLQDGKGNNAFCYAAAVGSIEIADFMLSLNKNLLRSRGAEQMTPLYFAALFGKGKMASFLYGQGQEKLEREDLINIFFVSIETGLYDFALKLVNANKKLLAEAHRVRYGTALNILARNPSAFTCSGPAWLKVPGMKFMTNNTDSSTQALELVGCLWNETLKRPHTDVLNLLREFLFDAAKLGNSKFLAVLICSYPDLVHQLDDDNRSIFHIAAMHRHADIFNLIYEIGFYKELIATYVDNHGNNLLHLAAQYSNPKPISKVPGAALEMQKELLTFKEVEAIVKPSYKEMKNGDNKTPWELFTEEHKTLLEEGEKWMKSRAESCSIVAILVATVVFQAAFTLPGGNKDGQGTPNFFGRTWFHIFVVSDAIAFSCSSISTLTFLSILTTSSYRESDFLMRLPCKMLFGLLTLFIAITTMMLSFSASFFLAYHERMNTFSMLTIILVFLPVALYALLQCRLLGDIFSSTYRSRFLLEPSNIS